MVLNKTGLILHRVICCLLFSFYDMPSLYVDKMFFYIILYIAWISILSISTY